MSGEMSSLGNGFVNTQLLKGSKGNMGAQNLYMSRAGKKDVLYEIHTDLQLYKTVCYANASSA